MTGQTYIPNFPDILGTITDQQRVNIGLVQVALAIRPRVLRAGRPFETLLIVQNASDIPVDFMARVHLPERDSDGKKGRFVCKVDKLVIGLEAAEVGYVVLPVSTLPDTAISSDYSITMDIQVKPASENKPKRVRLIEGGGHVETENLKDDTVTAIEELGHLTWTAEKVSGLRSTGLEIKFGLMSGTVGKIADLKPGWVSLWTMDDLVDHALLIQRFRPQLASKLLPALKLDKVYQETHDMTVSNFQEAGFPLTRWEAILISKLLTLILIFASPSKVHELVADKYNLKPVVAENANLTDVKLPKWTAQFLSLMSREPRAIQYPVKSILNFCFEGLLQDAIDLGFERIELILSESLGTQEERGIYRDQLIADYEEKQLSFSMVYVPLLLGGITAADMVVLPNDNMEDAVHDIRETVDARRQQFMDEGTASIFEMTDRLMEKVLLKYGYDAKRM